MPVKDAPITALLETLNTAARPTFPDLLEQLYRLNYCGPVTLHFIDGIPGVVEFAQPVQLKLQKGQ